MSHFYGTLNGSRGERTCCGSSLSGLLTIAASWQGAVSVRLWHDHATDQDKFIIEQRSWRGVGISTEIARGIVGEKIKKGVES